MKLVIDNQPVPLNTLRQAWLEPVEVSLSASARREVEASCTRINDLIAGGESIYGVNTGFGQLAQTRVPQEDLAQLQENLVLSHAVGVGEDLDESTVRLILLMKVIGLARGFSGIRPELVDAICALLNHGVYPRIPSKGSVGASGDLAPLAHAAGILIGAGEAHINGELIPAKKALAAAGLQALRLAPKEGLALLNGTQVSTALALGAAFRIENLLGATLVAGAMSSDAIKGSDTPFDHRIQDVRAHSGQLAVAGALRDLMQGSEIRASHLECDRVQDPYSIRCQPQVIGACLDVLRHACNVFEIEANAVTDNPLVFADSDSVLSGGNFHAEPVALAADYLALAVAEIGALSERRIALLIDSNMSGLPPFLVENSGLNSGFMLAQVTAAALASENKSLAHPASVDSLPTSANQEDHVSMATFAARRLHEMIDNVANITAIEQLAAAQGIEFHRPQRSSKVLEEAICEIRAASPRYTEDRSLAPDIASVSAMINSGAFCRQVASILPAQNRSSGGAH